MSVVTIILLVLLFCVTPAFVIWLCRKFPILNKLGPIMILYAIGMVVGNVGIAPEQMKLLQDILPNIMVPLAIPMMLYCCHFSTRHLNLQLKLVLSGFLSVIVAVAVGYWLFGCKLDEGAQIGGIITGMYTGGTLNAAALQQIFKIKSETYVLLNSYDIIISFSYFVFLFGCGIRLFRWLYGQSAKSGIPNDQVEVKQQNQNPYSALLTRAGAVQLAKILGITVVIAAISAGVALLMPEGWFMVVFILVLTTLGVACSFNKSVRSLNMSYDLGMYLIYIFSMVIASMADFSSLDLQSGINQFAYMAVAVFLSLLLHAFMCRFMRVDADSMVISSVAFINSPPFVPMVAAAMRNREVVVTGLAAGIVGYALGNHLGVLMAHILMSL